MRKNLARSSAFLLVAGSKTIYNIGQTCLTVHETIMAAYCLIHFYNKPNKLSKHVEVFSIAMQVLAATISTTVVAWSRYQAIWDKLSVKGVKQKYGDLRTELESCSKTTIATFILIAVFGTLSCVARGFSSYLGTEVIFRERFKIDNVGVDIAAGIVAVTSTVASLCFNLSNMLTDAAKYLKKPSFTFSFKVVFGFIAVLTGAIITRFFIKEFLDRRGVGESGQIVAQSLFFVAQFIMDCFTMGSSLKENCWSKAKTTLKSSVLFSAFMFSDVVSTWLGYTSIALYTILVDAFITKSASGKKNNTLCFSDKTDMTFALRCSFIGFVLVTAVPKVITYFNYILSHSKNGYDNTVHFLRSPSACCRATFFVDLESAEAKPLQPKDANAINASDQAYVF